MAFTILLMLEIYQRLWKSNLKTMNNIPPKLRAELTEDPFYKTCARKNLFGHTCDGRITWEHAMTYAGKQIQARFAIIPLCTKAHSIDNYQDSGDLNKNLNVWIALNRATDDELISISRAMDYFKYRAYLNDYFGGVYTEPLLEPIWLALNKK